LGKEKVKISILEVNPKKIKTAVKGGLPGTGALKKRQRGVADCPP